MYYYSLHRLDFTHSQEKIYHVRIWKYQNFWTYSQPPDTDYWQLVLSSVMEIYTWSKTWVHLLGVSIISIR